MARSLLSSVIHDFRGKWPLLVPLLLWGCGVQPGQNGAFTTEECEGEECEGDGDSGMTVGDGDAGGSDAGDGDASDSGGVPGTGGAGAFVPGSGGMMPGAGGEMMMPGTGGGMMMPGSGGMAASDCGSCETGMVCCPDDLPCAGMCVPDCRTGGACPNAELTCDEMSGVCRPASMGSGGATMGSGGGPMMGSGGMGMGSGGGPMMGSGGGPMMGSGGGPTMGSGGGPMMGSGGGPMMGSGGTGMGSGGSPMEEPPVVDPPDSGTASLEVLLSESNSRFGQGVAIDGGTVVVGDQDAAYVYEWSGTAWSLSATLVPFSTGPSPAPTNTGFGYAVAIEGEMIAVGAPQSGEVFVYSLDGDGNWAELDVISDGLSMFGVSVAIEDEVLFVGSPNDGSGDLRFTGEVHAFERVMNSWDQTIISSANLDPVADSDAWFGFSLSVRDGVLLVGAPGSVQSVDEDNPTYTGKAYVFTGSGSTFTEQQILTPSDTTALQYFGSSVSFAGTTAVVGAPGNPGGYLSFPEGTLVGSAYVFAGSPGTMSETGHLLGTGTAGDRFGAGVAVLGDDRILVARETSPMGSPAVLTEYNYVAMAWSAGAVHSDCDGESGPNVAVDGDIAVTGSQINAPGTSAAIFDLEDADTTCLSNE